MTKKERLSTGLQKFLNFLVWMLVFGLAVRLFETALLTHYHLEFPKQIKLCLLGFGYDVLLFSKIALVLCPVFLLLNHFSEKVARWTFRIIGFLILLISNSMIMYFVAAFVPLDKIFFDYSVHDLFYIASASESFVWWGYVFLLLIPAAFLLLSGHEFRPGKVSLFVWLALAIAGLFVWKVPERLYQNNDEKNTIDNKQAFFFGSLFSTENSFVKININAENSQEDLERVKAFQSLFPETDFINGNYPFAHIDKSPDVLSTFFNLDLDAKPNFVFIITEGLGREFCGTNCIYPSPMPFFDSLASVSLSWDNCLSSSQRTFAVLPTIFGNLPFGEHGFLQSPNGPHYNSLIKILSQNGYTPSFLYGGWLCFDEMCYFLNDNDVNNFLPDYQTYPQEMWSSWGLYDEYLFSESFKHIDFDCGKPRLDIYLTLTTHDPFEYPNSESYIERYRQKLVSTNSTDKVYKHLYKCYASYSYFDDCLRNFMRSYKSKPGYENTIFIITGDHSFYSSINEFNKYYVPLVIWSPMLKDKKEFPAIVTHRDITPSILAMMKSAYGIKTPDTVAWINTGLDTVSYFRSKTFSPQLKASRIMSNMIFGDYYYDDGRVYKINYQNKVLSLIPEENEQVKHLLSEYKALDDYVMNNDALLPREDNNWLMVSIDSLQSQHFTKGRANVIPIDTLGKNNVFMLSRSHPFDFAKIDLKNNLKSVNLQCEFDIYIPKFEDDFDINVGFEINKGRGRKNIKAIPINYFYQYYDQWHHFSMTQRFEKSVYNYKDGDKIYGYLLNSNKKKFFIANFRMKVIGTLEETQNLK